MARRPIRLQEKKRISWTTTSYDRECNGTRHSEPFHQIDHTVSAPSTPRKNDFTETDDDLEYYNVQRVIHLIVNESNNAAVSNNEPIQPTSMMKTSAIN